jgi:hypothetical protein
LYVPTYGRNFFCADADARRHSLRPLIGEGGKLIANLARNAWRDREAVSEKQVGCFNVTHNTNRFVMPGLDPGIHPSSQEASAKKMDCRLEPGNDSLKVVCAQSIAIQITSPRLRERSARNAG